MVWANKQRGASAKRALGSGGGRPTCGICRAALKRNLEKQSGSPKIQIPSQVISTGNPPRAGIAAASATGSDTHVNSIVGLAIILDMYSFMNQNAYKEHHAALLGDPPTCFLPSAEFSHTPFRDMPV
jgi:hypothetical protein